MASSSGSEYEPDEYDLDMDEDFRLDTKGGSGRRRSSSGGGGRKSSIVTRSRAGSQGPMSEEDQEDGTEVDTEAGQESGYTTGGYTTGEEDDDMAMFGEELDPLALLEDMEAAGAPDDVGVPGGGGGGLQPFQVFRKQRQAAAAAVRQQRQAAGDDTQEDGGLYTDATDAQTEGEATDGGEAGRSKAGPSTGRKRGGSKARRRGNAFGADFDDIADLADDPLAQQLGLVAPARTRKQKSRMRRKAKSKRGQIPEEVASQLGQANLLYANGEYQEAASLLMKVIKVAPNLSDPYHTLGLLHEAMGNSRKALDFHMIAAHLTPKDISLWKRLAALSTEIGYLRQAIYCLTKAVNHSPGRLEPDARWDRALLHAELGELNKAARQFEQVASIRQGDPEVPKMLARLHHRQGLPTKAISVLEDFMEQYPGSTDLTHINILAELYMETGAFESTHTLITRAAEALSNSMQEDEDGEEQPGSLPMDLVAKDGLCLAHLGRLPEAEQVLSPLRESGPATYPDLYLDVGVALVAMGQYDAARQYLQGLLDVPEFGSDPALWARLLMCHRALGDLPAAVDLYETKLDQLPTSDASYMETAITLCELWSEAGETAKATELLRSLPEQSVLPLAITGGSAGPSTSSAPTSATPAAARQSAMIPTLLMRKNKLHLQLGQQDEFIDAVLPLVKAALAKLASDNAAVSNPSLPQHIIKAIMRRRMLERKGLALHRMRGDDGSLFMGRVTSDRRREHVKKADEEAEAALAAMELGDDEVEGELGRNPSKATALRAMFTDDDGLNTFITLCRSLVDAGRVADSLELSTQAASLCGAVCRWFPRARRDLLAMLLAENMHTAGDIPAALKSLRSVLTRWPASCQAWSQVAQLGITQPTLCASRAWSSLITSARKRLPGSIPAMIMQGHVHAMSRQYGDALSEYFQAYRFWPTEPLLLLCIGVTYISHAITRRCDDRNKAVLQGFAFLQMYEEQRGNIQESSYNIGRAAHQLGLLHIAQHYYERALTAVKEPMSTQPESIGRHHNKAQAQSLCPEIAHNLAIIYRASGATHLVRQLYMQYLTVS